MKRIPVSFVWLPERARQAHPRPLKPSNIFEFNNVINSSSVLRGLSKSNGREQLSVFSFAGGNLHWYCMHWNDWIFRFSHVRSKLLIINLIQIVESFGSKRSRLKRFRSLPCASRFWVRPGLTSAWWNNIQEGLAIGEKVNVGKCKSCGMWIKTGDYFLPSLSFISNGKVEGNWPTSFISFFFWIKRSRSPKSFYHDHTIVWYTIPTFNVMLHICLFCEHHLCEANCVWQ